MKRTRALRSAAVYVGCALVLLCGHAALAATLPVTMTNFRFTPANVTINAGDTVRWNNQQGFHDSVSGANGTPNGLWNSSAQFGRLMFPGESFSFTFNSGGTFPYFCSPHVSVGMVGSVQVTAANTPPSITILSPPNGANFAAPADIVFQANPSDADGSITRVDFFVNGTPAGSATAPPYSVTLDDLGPGTYTLSATAFDNAGASASASVTVAVAGGDAPVVTASPQSQTVSPGNTVVFTVEATGALPLSFQWFRDQAAIPNATGTSLVLNNVTTNDAGLYTVIVSNAFGSASALARLSVGVPPDCEYTLSKTAASFEGSGGADAVMITTAPDCNWMVVNTNAWIVILSGASGTGPGTVNFLVLSNATETARTGALLIADQTFTVTQQGARFAAKNDFNHDGQSDFLWQDANGRLRLWLMSADEGGLSRVATLLLRNGRGMGRGWNVVGTRDFNLDNNVDILWQHTTGRLSIWLMNSTNFVRSEPIAGAPRPTRVWRVSGVGDLNQDGQADLLLRHKHGYLLAWFMSGTRFVNQTLLMNGEPVPAVWRVTGVADSDGDQQADVIWQGPDGSIVIWFMAGTIPTRGPRLTDLPEPGARLVGLNDLNHDGNLDFIWRELNGTLSTWLMNETNRVGSLQIRDAEVLSSAWKFVAPKE
jgi:plastocyanin